MIRFLLSLFGFGNKKNDLPSFRVYLGSDFGDLDAGTLYRLLRPSRWAAV